MSEKESEREIEREKDRVKQRERRAIFRFIVQQIIVLLAPAICQWSFAKNRFSIVSTLFLL